MTFIKNPSITKTTQINELLSEYFPSLIKFFKTEEYILKIYKKGELIFWDGDDIPFMFLIISGSVHLKKCLTADGKEMIVAIRQSGDVLGEGIITNTEEVYSAICKQDCIVMIIDKKNVFNSQELQQFLLQKIAMYNKEYIEKMFCVNRKVAKQRIVLGLINIIKNWKLKEETEFLLMASQNDIAEFFCLSRETTSREIKKLQKNSVIRKGGTKKYYINIAMLIVEAKKLND